VTRRACLIAISALLLLALAVDGSAFSGNAVEPTAAARTRIEFQDRFNGTALHEKRWRTCFWWSNHGCTIATNDELEWYQHSQVRVGGGSAHLVAERRRVRGDGETHRYVSGMINTGPGPERGSKFQFTYGRATMRARVPFGPGMWPAFWLLPANRQSEPEIDVMEVTSDEPRTVDMHFHYRRGGEELSLGEAWTGLTRGWHKFAIDWRPGRLTWFIDGKRRWRVKGAKVPSRPMYLIANLAVDGDPAPTAETDFPADFKIDWIKVTR
jgi:beta-glucanase (GH16 family)